MRCKCPIYTTISYISAVFQNYCFSGLYILPVSRPGMLYPRQHTLKKNSDMLKCLYLFLFFVLAQNSQSFAQHHRSELLNKTSTNDYYICISGINSRTDIETLENTIQKKTGVVQFLGDKYPPRYFTLKSTTPVTLEQFKSWIDTNRFKVEFYGNGISNLERAIVIGKKLITIRTN